MGEMTEADAWWLGQAGERRITATGWIGEHPVNGQDVAHLLLYPLGGGVARQMLQLSGALGLTGADAGPMTSVPPDTTWATLGPAPEGPSVWLHYGDQAWLHRPVTPEWENAAQHQRMLVLTVSLDTITIRPGRAQLDEIGRHLSARPQRLQIGLVRLGQLAGPG